MALAGDSNLQCLSNPPGGVSRQPGAMADIETVNRLHEPANSFLQKIGISQRMVTEPLGDVSGQTYISGGEPVLAVNVAIMHPANVDLLAGVGVAVVPNKLSHGPGFQRPAMSPQLWE